MNKELDCEQDVSAILLDTMEASGSKMRRKLEFLLDYCEEKGINFTNLTPKDYSDFYSYFAVKKIPNNLTLTHPEWKAFVAILKKKD